MNHQEWLNWRRGGIGSSDAPTIMKASPWTTPYQLWEQKVFQTETPDNPYMKRGRDMEPIARACLEKKLGVQLFPKNEQHKDINWMRASLDGIDDNREVLVEIKCPNRPLGEKKIPDHYYPQVQHQMEVAGLDHMYFFVFDGFDGVVIEVGKDQKYIDNLIKEELHFWNCVLEMEAPELTDNDWASMDHNETWTSTAERWQKTNEQLKSLEKEEALLRDKLIELAANKNAKGANLRLTKSLTKGAVDYMRVPELKGINLELYRKNSFTKWRLSAT